MFMTKPSEGEILVAGSLVLMMVYIHKRREIEVDKDNTVLCFRTRVNIKYTFEGYEGLSASVNVGRFLVHRNANHLAWDISLSGFDSSHVFCFIVHCS